MSFKTLAIIAAAGFISQPVLAASDAQEYAKLAKGTSITLAQAIAAAEKHVGGQAVSADLDDKRGVATFDVEVLASDRLYDVHVSADGTVGKVKEDLD